MPFSSILYFQLFSAARSETQILQVFEDNKIGNVKYFGLVMSLCCETNQEACMKHRSHCDFGPNCCFHRLEWALHRCSAATDSFRQEVLLWVKIGIKKEWI